MSERSERFVEVARLAARQAGAVASRLQGEVSRWEKEGEATPESSALTTADLACQDILLLALHDTFPDIAVDAEEDTDTVGLFLPEDGARPVVVLDPIDGTFNYSRGSRDYAVMAGWIEDGRYAAAVVLFPEWGELLWTADGRTVHRERDGGELERVTLPPRTSRVQVAPGLDDAQTAALEALGLEVTVCRCSAVDSSAPARTGDSAASIGPLDRRRAIALFLTAAAGGTVLAGGRPWRGEDPARIGGPRPVVTAADEDAARRILGPLLATRG